MASIPSRSASLAAPVGGWDTRRALADMPEKNAVICDNWFPETDKLTVRRGSSSFATGMSGAVDTLFEYTGVDGTPELFAANGGNVYDVTAGGAVGAAAVSGLTNDQWQQVQIGTAGGQFLLAMNGADTPITYNGSAWSTMSVTGPTAANLVWCNMHQRRLWFGEIDSLTAWYFPVNTISGAASSFSLAAIAKLGGYIVAMGTWTRDSGDGADDVAVFLTSEGEAIVYQGTDPASASTWGLVGVFRIGKPIGRRCMIKAGGDLIVVTQDGFVSAAIALATDRAQTEKIAISAQINQAVNDAVRSYGSLYGWQPFIYPKGRQLLFNVPQSATSAHQYVFNTITKAPCRFKGLNARCWGMMGDNAYFGGADGVVYLYDTGTDDGGAAIETDALQAFNPFKSAGTNKAFKLVEAVFESTGNPNAALDLCIDYQVTAPTGLASPSPTSAAVWDVSKWDEGTWGTDGQIYRGWRGVRGIGRAAALRVRTSSNSARPSWISTNFTYIPGGQL